MLRRLLKQLNFPSGMGLKSIFELNWSALISKFLFLLTANQFYQLGLGGVLVCFLIQLLYDQFWPTFKKAWQPCFKDVLMFFFKNCLPRSTMIVHIVFYTVSVHSSRGYCVAFKPQNLKSWDWSGVYDVASYSFKLFITYADIQSSTVS